MSSSSSSFQQQQPLPPQQQIQQQKFSKQMQAKFMKDLQNIQIGDSDSELQASSDFYQGLKKKITTQMSTMRQQQSTTKNSIITQLKATLTKQITNAEEFQQQIKEMKYLNTQAKSVINQEKILEIKSKLMAQSGVNSRIMLAEEIVELRESQLRQQGEGQAIFEQVQLEQQQGLGQNSQIVKQQQQQRIKDNNINDNTKRSLMSKRTQKATTLLSSNSKHKLQQFKKKPTLFVNTLNNQNNNKQIDNKIAKKLNEINLQRQRINMQRQDDRSMRYEKQCISQFFKQRFIKFTIPKTQTMKMFQSIKLIKVTKPKSTFTNLQPLANNQKNVLPRNAPEIALKALKKTKRVSLKAASQTMVKIEFKKKEIDFEQQQISLFGGNNNIGVQQIKNQQQKHQQNNYKQQQQEIFRKILRPYIEQIQRPLKQLQQISSVYKPKFIRNYLNENEKISNIAMVDDFDGEEQQFQQTGIKNNKNNKKNNNKQRSIQQILSFQDQVNSNGNNNKQSQSPTISKLKEFKLTFENVTSIKGIQKFTSVQYIALQYNQITKINQLQLFVTNNNNLIELNLSNNLIKQVKPIERLRQLRYLNMANNKLRQFQFYGGKLEILQLKKNHIEVINDLGDNKYLRIVNLEENKLHDLIKGFKGLYYLQELLLAKNYIQSLSGIQAMLMLQTLDVSHNRLSKINHNLVYLFLNTLNVSYNQLQVIPNMFLPSLQRFYLTNNKLTGDNIKQRVYYLPQLKQLNLDDNQIKGFSTVWAFISYSKKLEIIKYDSNEYFLSVRQKVRQLYQAIIYKYMQNIKIINHNVYDTGIKAYYESVYSSYLEKSQTLLSTKGNLKNVQQFVSCLLEENKVIANLQNKFSKLYHQRFVQQEVFVKRKSISRAAMLEKVVGMLSEGLGRELGKGFGGGINKNQGNIGNNLNNDKMSNKNNYAILLINNQIYFYHDLFQVNLLNKVHKIKSLFYKFKYKKEKRKKYFFKQKEKILKLFKPIEDMIFVNKLKQVINSFAKCIRVNRQLQAVIMIQKHWRGYKSRKLFKKLLKKLKQNVQDEDFQLQQVDLDEFQEHQFPQFNFDLPEDINFDNYIIEPKYFQLAQQKQTKRRQLSKHSTGEINNKNKKGLQNIQQQQQQQKEYNPMMNNFVKEQKVKQDKLKKKQQDQKLMKQWGFTNPATLQALRWKKKRKQQMKKKQAQQNMTAAQRYQRFKMLHK